MTRSGNMGEDPRTREHYTTCPCDADQEAECTCDQRDDDDREAAEEGR